MADGFAANEMPLTGESMPVRKVATTAKKEKDGGMEAIEEKAPAEPEHEEGEGDAEEEKKAPAPEAEKPKADDKEAAEKKKKEEMRKKIALTERNCVYMGCQVVEGNGRVSHTRLALSLRARIDRLIRAAMDGWMGRCGLGWSVTGYCGEDRYELQNG